jgi:hypothetical protein
MGTEMASAIRSNGVADPPHFPHVKLQHLGDLVSQNLVGLISGVLGEKPLSVASGLAVPATEPGSGAAAAAGYVVFGGDVQAR